MDIQLQKKSPLEGIITIQVKESDYTSMTEEKIREYSKNSRMKGFRPGHIPLSLIKKLYGAGVLMETISTLLSNHLTNYLQEGNITIVGEPLPEEGVMQKIDWTRQREFEFRYSIGFVEETDLVLSKDWQVTAYKIDQIADETVDSIIRNLRRTYGERKLAEKSVISDIIYGELRHQEKKITKQIRLFIEETKEEIQKALIDLEVGDQISINIQDVLKQGMQLLEAEEKALQELMAMEGLFELVVKTIERPVLAELDQALFDKVLEGGSVSSLAEFRMKIQEDVIRDKQKKADHLLESAIKDLLLKHVAINLPDDFLKRWLQHKKADLPEEAIISYYEEYYVPKLCWELIVQKIIKFYHLEVTPNEVIAATKNHFLKFYDNSEQFVDQLIRTFLQENKGDNYRRMHQELLLDKVFKCVKEQITIITQAISVEEFDKLAQ